MDELDRLVLEEGTDDWVPLVAIAGFARQLGHHSAVQVQNAVLQSLKRMAEGGLIEIGTVDHSGFHAWTTPVGESLSKLEEAFRSESAAQWDFLAWTCNTEEGDRQATSSVNRRVSTQED